MPREDPFDFSIAEIRKHHIHMKVTLPFFPPFDISENHPTQSYQRKPSNAVSPAKTIQRSLTSENHPTQSHQRKPSNAVSPAKTIQHNHISEFPDKQCNIFLFFTKKKIPMFNSMTCAVSHCVHSPHSQYSIAYAIRSDANIFEYDPQSHAHSVLSPLMFQYNTPLQSSIPSDPLVPE
jgi:hypothetical protein